MRAIAFASDICARAPGARLIQRPPWLMVRLIGARAPLPAPGRQSVILISRAASAGNAFYQKLRPPTANSHNYLARGRALMMHCTHESGGAWWRAPSGLLVFGQRAPTPAAGLANNSCEIKFAPGAGALLDLRAPALGGAQVSAKRIPGGWVVRAPLERPYADRADESRAPAAPSGVSARARPNCARASLARN